MMLLKTVKEIILDTLYEDKSVDYSTLRKVFKYNTDKLYGYLLKRGDLDSFIEDIISDDSDESRELFHNIISGIISEKSTPQLIKYTSNVFSDLTYEDGVLYLTLDSKSDLSSLFYDDRDYSKDSIKEILSGEMDFYNGYNSGRSEMDYFLDDLNEVNMKVLKDIIVEKGLGNTVDYTGDNEILLGLLSEDDNVLMQDSIDEIFRSDSNIIDALYGMDIFDDVKDNLLGIYDRANEGALSDTYYERVMSSIEDFFGETGEVFDTGRKKTVSYGDKGESFTHSVENYKISISDSLYTSAIEWWLDEWDDMYDLDYWGDFEGFLTEYCESLDYRDSLTFRVPDYADSDKVKDYMNETFLDYIYD